MSLPLARSRLQSLNCRVEACFSQSFLVELIPWCLDKGRNITPKDIKRYGIIKPLLILCKKSASTVWWEGSSNKIE